MIARIFRRFLNALLLGQAALAVHAADLQEVPDHAARTSAFVGANGCKSSGCHGGAGEGKDQYLTWSGSDHHSTSAAVLATAQSKQIAATLGVASAVESSQCTSCHAPMKEVLNLPNEGVSCESCHNAAEAWILSHTRPDYTHAQRVKAGLRDLRDLPMRANTCVACHENLSPTLTAAGHPPLRFELDGQVVSQPRHWMDKDPWIGPRSWLVGQATALRERAWSLGTTPDPDAQKRMEALAWLLTTVAPQRNFAAPAPAVGDLAGWQTWANALAQDAGKRTWNVEETRALMTSLARPAAGSDALTHAQAEALVMAIDRLHTALERNQAAPSQTADPLKRLCLTVAESYRYDPVVFARVLGDFNAALAK